jgi:hypothetical protein
LQLLSDVSWLRVSIHRKYGGGPKESGDNTSTSNQLSPLKDPKSTLKFTGVEVVEMSEIFSDLLLSR